MTPEDDDLDSLDPEPPRFPRTPYRTPRKSQRRTISAEPEAVSIPEAARLLGVHEQTVRNWIRRNAIRAFHTPSPGGSKYGQRWRITRDDIARFRVRNLNSTEPIRARKIRSKLLP